MGSIVHQDVDVSKIMDRSLDNAAAMRFSGDITADQHRPAASFLDPTCGVLGVIIFAEVGDHHVGTFAGKSDGHSAADSRIATSDNRNSVLQFARAAVTVFPVVRSGLHRIGATWRLLLLLGLALVGFGFG